MTALKQKKELGPYMKKAMPFAQMVKARAATMGESALSSQPTVDEIAVLEANTAYLASTLGLEGGVEAEAVVDVDKEEIMPQQPRIFYRAVVSMQNRKFPQDVLK